MPTCASRRRSRSAISAHPAAVDALLQALDDPDANVRFHAIEALGRLGARRRGRAAGGDRRVAGLLPAFPALDALALIGDARRRAPAGAAARRDPLLRSGSPKRSASLGDEDVVRAARRAR